MSRQTFTFQTLAVLLTAGIFCSLLQAQPPPETVTVTGTVTEAGTGQPAAGVTVTLTPRAEGLAGAGMEVERTETDVQGRFQVDAAEGPYTLSLTGPNYLPSSQALNVAVEMKPVTLTVKPLPRIRGQLRRADGTPLANAPLQVYLTYFAPFGGAAPEPKPATTDGEGRYQVPVPQPGTYLLTLVVPGVGYARSGELNVATEDLEGLDLPVRPAASVAGQVRVKGTDEPPRQVSLSVEEREGSLVRIRHTPSLDGQGRFTLRDLPGGTYQLQVLGEEYLRTPQAVTLTDGQAVTDLVLEVAPAPAVSGRLLAPDGTSLAGQEVEFVAYAQRGEGDESWREKKTLDEESGFLVRAPEAGPARVLLWVANVGYLRQELEIREGTDLTGREWQLKPFSTLTGQVREKRTQEPLAGIFVSLMRMGREPTPTPWLQARTGDDGRFALTGVTSGEYQVQVGLTGYRFPAMGSWIRVAEDTPPEDLLLEPERGTPVAGQVLEPDGATPVAGARVFIGRRGWFQSQERTTDADGRFDFESVVSERRGDSLQVQAEGFAEVSEPLRLEGPDHPVDLTLTLRDLGGTITGQVRDLDTGQPMAGGVVFAYDPTPSQWEDPPYFLRELTLWGPQRGPGIDFNQWPWDRLKALPHTLTDAEGRYALTHVAEGEYTLYALVPGAGYARRGGVAVQEGQETAGVDVGISPRPRPGRGGRFSGRLTGPDGKPLANVTVQFQLGFSGMGTTLSAQTDADGRYEVDLARYSWSLAVEGPGMLEVQVEGFRAARREPFELGATGRAENVDFQLAAEPLGCLAGRVFLPDGVTPAAGAWVVPVRPGRSGSALSIYQDRATLDGGEYVACAHQATVTDAEGRYRIERLTVGDYRVYVLPRIVRQYGALADAPANAPAPHPRLAEAAPALSDLVAVPENGTGEANVTLQETGVLEGVVRGAADGQPLANVPVCAQFRSGQGFPFEPGYERSVFDSAYEADFQAWTDAEGQFRIPGLPAGTYQLWVPDPGRRNPEKEVVITAGATARTELKLREPQVITVAGRVLRPDGQTPAPRAFVSLYSPSGDYGQPSVRTDAEGRFALTLTPTPGRVRVVARKVGYGRAVSEGFLLAPGGERRDVTLTLTEAGTISGQIQWADGTFVPDYERGEVVVMAIAPDEPLATVNPGQTGERRSNLLCRQARPDEDGRFTLTDVPAGRTTLAVFVRNLPWLVQRDVIVPAGGAPVGAGLVPALTLVVPPARGLISGRVMARDGGAPLAGIHMTVLNPEVGNYRLYMQTDDQGHYTFSGLPAGTYQVLAVPFPEGLWASQASAEVRVGEAPTPSPSPDLRGGEKEGVDFRLSTGGKVAGTVVGPGGQPVGGALVSTLSQESAGGGRVPAGLSMMATNTNGDGTYTLASLAPGEYTLYVNAPGYAETPQEGVVVREGETTKVDFMLTEAPPQASRPDPGRELMVKLRTERADNRFTDPDADLPLTLAVWNRTKEPKELEVAYTVTHGDGGHVAEGRDRLTFGPQRVTSFTFTIRPGQPGVYHAVVRLQGEAVDLTKTLDFEVQIT